MFTRKCTWEKKAIPEKQILTTENQQSIQLRQLKLRAASMRVEAAMNWIKTMIVLKVMLICRNNTTTLDKYSFVTAGRAYRQAVHYHRIIDTLKTHTDTLESFMLTAFTSIRSAPDKERISIVFHDRTAPFLFLEREMQHGRPTLRGCMVIYRPGEATVASGSHRERKKITLF